MKVVLLSGGSGKRLWPLSNDSRSKQFLKLLKSPDGRPESMVQRVWRQLASCGLGRSAYIATARSQVDVLHNQLGPDVPLIVEPSRRDTFPAIALSVLYLVSEAGVPSDETIAVLPVDPYVDDAFFERVQQLDFVLRDSGADLALIGVRPTHPSEKYGYIVPESAVSGRTYADVRRFTEKPSADEAERLIAEGALWNCGVFAFRAGFLLGELRARGLPAEYRAFRDAYDRLTAISFDYEVVEKVRRAVVMPYEGAWKDLGTWDALTEEMDGPVWGRGVIGPDSDGAHVVNELDIPVAVLGVPNVIVAAGPDGILVADRAASPRAKEVANEIRQRVMYEERRWGWYRVLDYAKLADGNEMLTRRVCLLEGRNLSYHVHRKRMETWTVLSGRGLVVLDDHQFSIQAGDVVRVHAGCRHSVKALSELEFIEVQSGSEVHEDDIERICMRWEDIPNRHSPA
ncbi:MAG: mannose-1-phosphate guanylyltransferase [Candidatus Reconcilbacillus cellulovorans]|uniref:Mannose-1-phosphate guanylyltransferase n=1 Tax=Candidatus Reconcilbacillus cellulovorans TaxID=1906605 RepID=A0A2A6DZC0_9BACL|nr:MAG: mannose-1-phosphate guanylyltransferase [Candidatus Reconcilbacillus cellulovorans]